MEYSEDHPDTWTRVDQLFTKALDLAPERRAAFLKAECGDDEALYTEVVSLLDAAGEMDEGFLGTPALPLTEESGELTAGLRIGPYRVIEEIGRGGMGKIFSAVRADAVYEQRVAIKILKRGLDTDEIVRRFRAERRLLALLDHPNIVRILDGGTTENGLPYFVMEYVEGQTIDRYCADRELSLRERLALFREVCAAVGFAHQNLVIHRDLKPQNILVDARGEPKLLDFGIAKLLDADELVTRVGTQLMTPAYASPEQAAGGPVTTASDVYSLGRLLYEILTGQRALQPTIPDNPLSSKPAVDVLPDPPSREPGCRHLAGDLDSIVLKALAPDPRRRYPTVEQLVQDIDRYLGGQPVQARASTFLYRAGKFLRRNRWSVLFGLLLVVSLVSFALAMKALSDSAMQSEVANQVFRDLADVLPALNPDRPRSAGSGDVLRESLRDFVDLYAERPTDHLEPRLRGDFKRTLGRIYVGLGEYREAEPLLRESVRLYEQVQGLPLEVLATAQTDWAFAQLKLDDRTGAETSLNRALKNLQASGAGTRLLVRALNNNALLLSQAGRYEMAEQLYRESLEMRTRLYGPSHLDTARAQHNLGGLLRNLGRLEESEKELLSSLASRVDRLGEESKDVATTRSSLALTLVDQGRLDEAELLLGQVVASRRADYGESHPRFVGAVVNLGFVLRLLERFDAADANFQIAEDFYVDQDRQQTLAFANVLRHRALVRLGQGRTDEAVELAARAVEICRATQDEGHWRVAEAESVLGECLLEQGRVDEARPLLQSSYRILADVFGDEARRTREAVARVAQLDAAS